MPHFRYPPLDDIAKVFVVDIIILFSNAPLGAFFQLILAVSIDVYKYNQLRKKPKWQGARALHIKTTYTLTSESFDRTAITLLSSFGWRPILPASSSSFKLEKRGGVGGNEMWSTITGRGQCILTPYAVQAGP